MAAGCEQATRNEQQTPRCPRFPIHASAKGARKSRGHPCRECDDLKACREKRQLMSVHVTPPFLPSNMANHVRRWDFAWSDETRSPKFRVMRLATSGVPRLASSGGSISGKGGTVYIRARSDPSGVPKGSQRDGSADNMSSEPKVGSNRRRGWRGEYALPTTLCSWPELRCT